MHLAVVVAALQATLSAPMIENCLTALCGLAVDNAANKALLGELGACAGVCWNRVVGVVCLVVC